MGTPVEVKDLETFGYYAATIKDVKEGEVLVQFEKDWKPEAWVPLANVRKAPKPPTGFVPAVGDVIEVMAKAEGNAPFSWWEATVKNVKGEFYLISYTAWGPEYDEILEKEQIRPQNTNRPLTQADIKKDSIPIPDEVCSDAREKAEDFQSYAIAGALSLSIDWDKKRFTVIGPENAVKRVLTLAKYNFIHFADMIKLKKKTEKLEADAKKLQRRKEEGFTETFSVNSSLLGLVIGVGGSHVQSVTEMTGVKNINVNNKDGTVTILAKDEATAKKARAMLEFVEAIVPIDRKQFGRLAGKNFANLKQLRDESGVTRIRVADGSEERRPRRGGGRGRQPRPVPKVDVGEDRVPLCITGTVEQVEYAKELLGVRLSHIKQILEAKESERSQVEKLKELKKHYGELSDEEDGGPKARRGGQKPQWRRSDEDQGQKRGGRGGYGYRGRGGGSYFQDDGYGEEAGEEDDEETGDQEDQTEQPQSGQTGKWGDEAEEETTTTTVSGSSSRPPRGRQPQRQYAPVSNNKQNKGGGRGAPASFQPKIQGSTDAKDSKPQEPKQTQNPKQATKSPQPTQPAKQTTSPAGKTEDSKAKNPSSSSSASSTSTTTSNSKKASDSAPKGKQEPKKEQEEPKGKSKALQKEKYVEKKPTTPPVKGKEQPKQQPKQEQEEEENEEDGEEEAGEEDGEE